MLAPRIREENDRIATRYESFTVRLQKALQVFYKSDLFLSSCSDKMARPLLRQFGDNFSLMSHDAVELIQLQELTGSEVTPFETLDRAKEELSLLNEVCAFVLILEPKDTCHHPKPTHLSDFNVDL